MKKTLILFLSLLIVFFVYWGVKVKSPINRPDNLEDAETEKPWYESDYTSPVPDQEWVLDPSIPENYVPVPGEENLFMVVDTSGVIIEYRKRTINDEGVWIWEDINPDIPVDYLLVNGSDNLYKKTNPDDTEEYFLYIRNADGSYAFVPCDEFGTPYYNNSDAEIIANNYIHEESNLYSTYNANGVKEGYVERVKDENGKYVWVALTNQEFETLKAQYQAQQNPDSSEHSTTQQDATESPNNDGTYVVTEKTTNTITENGYRITYETIVYNTYDKNDKLLYTKTEGPYEIERVKIEASDIPNPELVQDTLDGELARVSPQVTYNTEIANQILALLNAERINQGIGSLSMNTSSESYKLAQIRCADMAIYNYAATESPMYNTLDDMVARWGCVTANASENIWKTSPKSAEQIHMRLQAYDGSRNLRMAAEYTEVGIAVVEKDGQMFIVEIYLK